MLLAVPSIVPSTSEQLQATSFSALLPPSPPVLPPFLLLSPPAFCCDHASGCVVQHFSEAPWTQAKGQSGSASHIRSYSSRRISIITLEKFLQQTSTEYLCNIFQGLLIALRILWQSHLTHDLSFSMSSLELLPCT